jgi:microcystin-dependent protein
MCNGANYVLSSRPDLVNLYNVIGVNFGGVAGTNFNVPDLRSRFPIGYWAGGSGGNIANIGAHETSSVSGTAPGAGDPARLDHRHTHNVDATVATNTTASGGANRVTQVNGSTTGGPTSSTGVTGSGNIANHPFLTINFIIKI